MNAPLRIISAVLTVVFLLALAVQYNDPDPIPWMLMYGAAAINCAMAIQGRLSMLFAAVTGVAALVWALVLVPEVLGQVPLGDLFQETGMATLEIEEAREAIGLLLVVVWMAVLLWAYKVSDSTTRG